MEKTKEFKISKKKNEANKLWGVVERFWGYTLPVTEYPFNKEMMSEAIDNTDKYALYCASDMYKVLVLTAYSLALK